MGYQFTIMSLVNRQQKFNATQPGEQPGCNVRSSETNSTL